MSYQILAIDPGKTGSAALFTVWQTAIKLSFVFDLAAYGDTWEKQLHALLVYNRPAEIVMEGVHAMPWDGKKSAFSFGGNKKAIETVLKLAGYKWRTVDPKTWQLRLGLPKNRHLTERKKRREQGRKDQEALAIKLFPDLATAQGDIYASVLIGYAACLDKLGVPLGRLTP